jgi:queuosine precursor transporter
LSINNAAKQLDSFGAAAPAQGSALQKPVVILTRTAVIVIAAYIGAQMLADIASLKIGIVWGMAVDMGTFIYPITFTLRDVAHKTIGKKPTQSLIWMAAIINLFAAAYLWWVAGVTGDPSWGLNTEWSAVFNASLLWRIVLASIVAEVVSELVDTEIYHWFVTKVSHRHQWARVLASNSVSVPIDNLIFAVGAFGGVLPWDVVWQIFLFNLLLKYAVTLVSMPLIYITGDTDWKEQ